MKPRLPLQLYGLLSLWLASAALADDARLIARIGFGSCAKEDQPQPIWQAVLAQSPDLFLMVGDNIYGDTEDMALLRAKYAKLGAVEGFRRLRATCPILATWDDHDYGVNDGGAEYPRRVESQQAMLDFFGVPADSPRRRRAGVYHAETFGPPGKRVQVILLDTRYHRSPLKKGEWDPEGSGTPGAYLALDDPQATMLGDEQWTWLAGQLRQPAEVRIVASSIQVIPNEHRFEKWGNLPRERERLFNLIAETSANGVIFISGDRHHAELSCLPAAAAAVKYPLYELTSSGLTQTTGWGNERNEHRLGSIYRDANFGLIRIDWTAADPLVALEIRRENGEIAILHQTALARLHP